ncbi:MAG: class II fructose-1,6-bisphosphate aldolase [Bacilli bacterium]|nr:class II fructose-1,6-bisphosphate aldolase [Bacilli bacterium]
MLVNSINMLQKAKNEKYAIPQFNINNLEWTRYILEECEKNKVPVILGVSEGAAKYMGGFFVVTSLVDALIKELNITVDVCIHLDHGSSFEVCKKAIDSGFTSVMIDASKYPLEDNIKITKEVVDYAHQNNVSVEAEVGHIGGEEDGVSSDVYHATLEECIALAKTGIDSIAPALGSVHGLYKGLPNLNFERMALINQELNIPLVLHGGTGIPDSDIKKAIECGISKININTELQIAWHDAVLLFVKENDKVYDPRKVIGSGQENMKKAISSKINLFLNR